MVKDLAGRKNGLSLDPLNIVVKAVTMALPTHSSRNISSIIIVAIAASAMYL